MTAARSNDTKNSPESSEIGSVQQYLFLMILGGFVMMFILLNIMYVNFRIDSLQRNIPPPLFKAQVEDHEARIRKLEK